MSITVNLSCSNGKQYPLTVKLTDQIKTGKKLANQENAVWKYNGQVLSNEKTFEFYDIEDEDAIVTNTKVIGGNNLNK